MCSREVKVGSAKNKQHVWANGLPLITVTGGTYETSRWNTRVYKYTGKQMPSCNQQYWSWHMHTRLQVTYDWWYWSCQPTVLSNQWPYYHLDPTQGTTWMYMILGPTPSLAYRNRIHSTFILRVLCTDTQIVSHTKTVIKYHRDRKDPCWRDRSL